MTPTTLMTRLLRARGRALVASALLGAAAAAAACAKYDITNPNQPTVDDLLQHPTRSKLSAAATGVFASARTDMTALIWRLGSLGREGINLAGNNQPDYQEPYFGPVAPGGSFGGTLWGLRYQAVRTMNTFLKALDASGELSAAERAGGRAVAKTLKALVFMYIIETRASLGAPVDVDRPIDAPPAPFVSEDSVYGYALGLLDEAKADLQAAASGFFFPLPPGYSGFDTPATFLKFNRALAAKAHVLRATANASGSPKRTAEFQKALAILASPDSTFLALDAAALQAGVYFNYGSGAGDVANDLSDPLNGIRYFARAAYKFENPDVAGDTIRVPSLIEEAQLQVNGQPDLRILQKVTPATRVPVQSVGGVPLHGDLKFTVYFTNGAPDPSHPIPIIKNEELILLRAEAKIGLGNLGTPGSGGALDDINFIRQNSGNLPPLAGFASQDAAITELLYNRAYSLLWEQGTRWIDARRYGRLASLPRNMASNPIAGRMPIPATECSARGLTAPCSPLGT